MKASNRLLARTSNVLTHSWLHVLEALQHPLHLPRIAWWLIRHRAHLGELLKLLRFRTWLRQAGIQTVIDVGANTGQFSSAVRALLPDAQIYAFEPLTDCCRRLTRRLARFGRFEAFPLALGAKRGETSFFKNQFTQASSILPMSGLHKQAFPWSTQMTRQTVPEETLDAMAPHLQWGPRVLLKIDVQGYELKVLEGARQTLPRIDYVIVESSFKNLYEGQASFEEVYEELTRQGFEYLGSMEQLISPLDGTILQADLLFARRPAPPPASLRLAIVFNRYFYRGGEDQVFEAESRLLEGRGAEVLRLTEGAVNPTGLPEQARVGVHAVWSRRWRRDFERFLATNRPQLVHVHNWFPSLSPSIYYACQSANVPLVQTLHNYRVFCPAAILHRDGHVCEDCLGKTMPWPGILHACYHGSRSHTAGVAAVLTVHNLMRTWHDCVDLYICLTEFARQKFIEGGLPPDKLVVKPNFVERDPGRGTGRGGYALYVGRLTEEKGVTVLLDAWQQLGRRIPLKIIGEGPLAPRVEQACQRSPGVEYLGRRPHTDALDAMKEATLLVFPSVWYETFGLTIIEAFAVGLPVVASRLGCMESLVTHERTGRHFTAGDADDLCAQVEQLLAHPAALADLREAARREYENKYTADRNYEMLQQIYQQAIARHRARK